MTDTSHDDATPDTDKGPDMTTLPPPPSETEWKSLQSWANFIRIIGIPGVLALALVYWLAATADAQLVRIDDKLTQHEMARITSTQAMNAYLYAICLNTATDAPALARCAVALSGGLAAIPTPAK